MKFKAKIAQSAEHSHGKGEVPGSIPGLGSDRRKETRQGANCFAPVGYRKAESCREYLERRTSPGRKRLVNDEQGEE